MPRIWDSIPKRVEDLLIRSYGLYYLSRYKAVVRLLSEHLEYLTKFKTIKSEIYRILSYSQYKLYNYKDSLYSIAEGLKHDENNLKLINNLESIATESIAVMQRYCQEENWVKLSELAKAYIDCYDDSNEQVLYMC